MEKSTRAAQFHSFFTPLNIFFFFCNAVCFYLIKLSQSQKAVRLFWNDENIPRTQRNTAYFCIFVPNIFFEMSINLTMWKVCIRTSLVLQSQPSTYKIIYLWWNSRLCVEEWGKSDDTVDSRVALRRPENRQTFHLTWYIISRWRCFFHLLNVCWGVVIQNAMSRPPLDLTESLALIVRGRE